ncbi:hypothetical protein [Flavobacterium eburneipallidum]|uniref:hypothetical protein n=1 Tax=Flavobacterium eburneipallidum TaxID=3003263 RepID=UPI0024832438|nr:hypothetical protein [Flavobacterium eburneipallidum]
MKEINQLIDNLENLNNLISGEINKHNENDIRNVTLDLVATRIQDFRTSLILSKNINKKWLFENNSNEHYSDIEIKTFISNFVHNQIDAFFINTFMYIEAHIRLIAKYYENSNNKILNFKISQTFENLTNNNKIQLFENISEENKLLFKFYLSLRNTIHTGHFHTWDYDFFIINDKSSIIDKTEKKLELHKNKYVEINPFEKLLLIEQIIKLILKINSKIPNNTIIEHSYVDIGYNE